MLLELLVDLTIKVGKVQTVNMAVISNAIGKDSSPEVQSLIKYTFLRLT